MVPLNYMLCAEALRRIVKPSETADRLRARRRTPRRRKSLDIIAHRPLPARKRPPERIGWMAESGRSTSVSVHPQVCVVEAVCGERHEYRATILSFSITWTIESRIPVRDVEIGRPSFSDPALGGQLASLIRARVFAFIRSACEPIVLLTRGHGFLSGRPALRRPRCLLCLVEFEQQHVAKPLCRRRQRASG
ncbi:hypothetical protein SAMN05414139_03736 [Burkholderia sp. D7]|nr:hypothetical protein SAMN05414139_03736 [Burkholderia sp. D7]